MGVDGSRPWTSLSVLGVGEGRRDGEEVKVSGVEIGVGPEGPPLLLGGEYHRGTIFLTDYNKQ